MTAIDVPAEQVEQVEQESGGGDGGGPSIRLGSSIVTIFGPPGSGKTNFVKWLLKQPQYRRHLIYDPMREYSETQYNVYRPAERRYDGGNEELNLLVDEMIVGQIPAARPAYFVIDEANRVVPNRKDPGSAVADLIDFNRHFEPGISVIAVSRRPSQLNTDLENLSNHIFVFGGRGKNDHRAYADIHRELPDLLEQKKKYEPVYVSGDGEIRRFDPVPDLGDTPTI